MSTEIRSNVDVVVYVLAKLGGTTQRIATEDVAFKAFELMPKRFSWVLKEYHKIPDKEVARLALEDAAKQKNGALVEGKYARDPSRDGWILTPRGIRWLEKNRDRIAAAVEDTGGVPGLTPMEAKRLRNQITRGPLFEMYVKGLLEEASPFMFTDMLRCSPDAPPNLIRSKSQRLMSQTQLAGDAELIDFLEACEARFCSLFKLEQEE